jgi:hypothetical protein
MEKICLQAEEFYLLAYNACSPLKVNGLHVVISQ